MSYKKRLLDEFADLKVKIVKLDNYLHENKNKTKNEKETVNFELMKLQLAKMNEYLDILEKRILLEMEETTLIETVISVDKKRSIFPID